MGCLFVHECSHLAGSASPLKLEELPFVTKNPAVQVYPWNSIKTHLGEANILGILSEALSANVQAILPDEPPLIRANTAAQDGLNQPDWGQITLHACSVFKDVALSHMTAS